MSVSQVNELRKRINKYVQDLDNHIAEVVDGNDELADLNRKQMSESKLSDGSTIGRSYSPGYAAWKAANFGYSGPVNLKLTGDLYKSLTFKTTSGKYNVLTGVPYALGLLAKYGDYLGIAPENQKAAFEITVPALRKIFIRDVLA